MKLQTDEREVLTGGALAEHAFGIKDEDMHVVFDILRSKLYKDPIGSICREVASNGRDSHREAGAPDLPIEIEMRDSKDSIFYDDGLNIIFRDFGVGLSPQRVADVYSKYGSSTKRDTNDQTGGFGLGAKTPFSYKDGFSVRTIYEGTEYGYSIIIDESKRGKIVLLHERPAPEGHGNMTEVIVPVDKSDAEEFETAVVKSTHFWAVRPKLLGFKHETFTEIHPPGKVTVTSEVPGKWKLFAAPGEFNAQFIESSVNAIIDGIYYPVDTNLLKGALAGASICLFFENGELTVSANREQLQYDDRTKELLLDRLDDALQVMRAEYDKKICGQPVFLKALEAHRHAAQYDPLYKSLVAYAGAPTWTSPTGESRAMDGIWSTEAHDAFIVTDVGTRAKYEPLGRLDTPSVASRADAVYILEAGTKPVPGANRTLFQKHRGGFVLIKQKEPDPDKPDPKYFDKLLKDASTVEDLGLVPVDITTVQATRSERTAKKQSITLRTANGSDSVARFEYVIDEEGKATYNGMPRKLVVMFIESERTFRDSQKSQAGHLAELIHVLDRGKSTLVVASESKRKLLSAQTSLEDLLEANRKDVTKLCLRYVLGTQVSDAAKYDSCALPPELEPAFKYLRDLRNTEWLRGIGVLLPMLKETGYYPAALPDHRAEIAAAKEIYPLLEHISSEHRRHYAKAMTELHELRREKAEREQGVLELQA